MHLLLWILQTFTVSQLILHLFTLKLYTSSSQAVLFLVLDLSLLPASIALFPWALFSFLMCDFFNLLLWKLPIMFQLTILQHRFEKFKRFFDQSAQMGFSSHKMFLHFLMSLKTSAAVHHCFLSCTNLVVFLQNTVVKGTRIFAFASMQIFNFVPLVSGPRN